MRVMVVDDSKFMRTLIGKAINDCAWNVVGEASDGNEVVQIYAKCNPDVVTMDITMTNMNGVEAVKTLIAKFPDACVVMVSAIGQQFAVLEAIKAGAMGYVVKPFESHQLRKEISSVFGRRQGA